MYHPASNAARCPARIKWEKTGGVLFECQAEGILGGIGDGGVGVGYETDQALPVGSLLDLTCIRCRPGKGAAGNRFESTKFCAGAGPIPVFGPGHETCAYGVPLDVVADALELSGVSDPVVEGLVLPKGFADAVQRVVGIAGGHSFHDACNFREGDARLQEDVNVVGHDDKGVQFVAAKLGAAQDGVFGVVGKFGVSEPSRAEASGVQSCIE